MKINYKLFTTGLIAVSINSIIAQCPIPSLVTASPSAICAGSSTTLNATAAGSSINWFTVPAGGVSVGTSSSGANIVFTPTATTTYYAESYAIGTVTLGYTGAMQTYTVLAGVTTLTIDARGAEGGGFGSGPGGLGGRAIGIMTVTPGEVLNIYVGGAGTYTTISSTGGFNGGGSVNASGSAGTGGGASDIRRGISLTNRVIVAGGGGGGSAYTGENRIGGSGGGMIGGTGTSWSTWPISGGVGGSQISGGAAGVSCCHVSTAGTLGNGGNGAGDGAGGGGGGGGYYGGGGGLFGAGGGGSSYFDSGTTFTSTTSGFQSGNGQIIITGASCVSASRTPVMLTVGSIPTISVTNGVICAGSSYTIVPSGASSYTYSSGSAVVTPTANTSYSVTGTSTLGCVSSNTAVSSVTVNANPTVVASTSNTLICSGESVVLTASTSATSYTWNTSATTMSVSVSPTVTSTYTVNVSNAVACVASSTITVTVNACVGINEAVANLISVYPNPSNGVLNISLTSELSKNSSLEIYDALGKLVAKQVLTNELNSINVSNLENGIYTFKVLNSYNIVKIGKLIKQ
jgi:hypothetical protein